MDSQAEVALRRGDLQHGGGLIEKDAHLGVIEPVTAADKMRNPEEIAAVAQFRWPVDFAVITTTTTTILAPGCQCHR